MKAIEVRAVSFDIANRLIGSDRLKRLIGMGIVQYARRSNAGHQAYILLDSLPQRYRLEAYRLAHLNSSLLS